MKAYGRIFLGIVSFTCVLLLASMPTAAIALIVASGLAFLIDRTIALSASLLNRVSRHCREALSRETDQIGQAPVSDEAAVELAETLSRLQRREHELSLAHAIRRCSDAELVLASSMRLQDEIALLRHHRMPKPFFETIRTSG